MVTRQLSPPRPSSSSALSPPYPISPTSPAGVFTRGRGDGVGEGGDQRGVAAGSDDNFSPGRPFPSSSLAGGVSTAHSPIVPYTYRDDAASEMLDLAGSGGLQVAWVCASQERDKVLLGGGSKHTDDTGFRVASASKRRVAIRQGSAESVVRLRRTHTCPPLLLFLLVVFRQWRGAVTQGARWGKWCSAAEKRWRRRWDILVLGQVLHSWQEWVRRLRACVILGSGTRRNAVLQSVLCWRRCCMQARRRRGARQVLAALLPVTLSMAWQLWYKVAFARGDMRTQTQLRRAAEVLRTKLVRSMAPPLRYAEKSSVSLTKEPCVWLAAAPCSFRGAK